MYNYNIIELHEPAAIAMKLTAGKKHRERTVTSVRSYFVAG